MPSQAKPSSSSKPRHKVTLGRTETSLLLLLLLLLLPRPPVLRVLVCAC